MRYIVKRENRFYQEVLGDVGQWVLSRRDATIYTNLEDAEYVAVNRGGVVVQV
jgi:hypothetical protein